jgi:hypothetical protein
VPDQPDQRRAAIQAVRDLLSSRTVRGLALDGITVDEFAARLVDAVHAAGRDGQDAIALGRRQAATDLRYAAHGRRQYARGAPPDDLAVLHAEADLLDLAANVAEGHLGPLYGWLPSWLWTAEMQRRLDEQTKAADYLEAVGPDGTPKLGVAVDEATLTRAMTAGIDEPTFRRESLGEWPIRVVPGLPDDRVLFVTPPCPEGCDHTHAVALDLSAPDDRDAPAETVPDGGDEAGQRHKLTEEDADG